MGTNSLRRSREPSRATIADALFSKVQQRVLGVLFGNPARTYYANEIISMAKSGTGAVQRELARLQAAGLVTATHIGNQKHFQANAAAPVFEELRTLVLKTSGLADTLRAALAASGSDIRAAFVFGSIAKHKDRATSDVDLMIVSDDLRYADLYSALEAAAKALGRKLNPTIYSHNEFARRVRTRNAFVTRVVAQPKIWLVGAERDLAT